MQFASHEYSSKTSLAYEGMSNGYKPSATALINYSPYTMEPRAPVTLAQVAVAHTCAGNGMDELAITNVDTDM